MWFTLTHTSLRFHPSKLVPRKASATIVEIQIGSIANFPNDCSFVRL
jgi:hypothetical protein